jgi:hypothetical protein
LLIKGVKGKVDVGGNITDDKTNKELVAFIEGFIKLVAGTTANM